MGTSSIKEALESDQKGLLAEWMQNQLQATTLRRDLIRDDELQRQSEDFLARFLRAVASGNDSDTRSPAWAPVRECLADLSRMRGRQGFSPTETAVFVFSLKEPVLQRLRQAHGADAEGLFRDTMTASRMLDSLGLHTMEVFQQAREEVISRQHEELLELSTPVVKLWDGVLALPLIGTLDSARTSVVMEALLQRVVETGSEIAIIDITGVPTVDTLVAQHLLKTVAAARLMGADCIISGIRPQIAQTIVHLAIDLSNVVTKATLAEALATALARMGHRIVRDGTPAPASPPAPIASTL